MAKLTRPNSLGTTKTTKLQRVWNVISENFWSGVVIFVVVALVVYTVVIQILHHP